MSVWYNYLYNHGRVSGWWKSTAVFSHYSHLPVLRYKYYIGWCKKMSQILKFCHCQHILLKFYALPPKNTLIGRWLFHKKIWSKTDIMHQRVSKTINRLILSAQSTKTPGSGSTCLSTSLSKLSCLKMLVWICLGLISLHTFEIICGL